MSLSPQQEMHAVAILWKACPCDGLVSCILENSSGTGHKPRQRQVQDSPRIQCYPQLALVKIEWSWSFAVKAKACCSQPKPAGVVIVPS